ncbi:hypothetical protein SAMD00023353_2000550 [Rosellinia necatrix]|uniref:Uncharacterized protein n=1 Tax=Rosellinia necatrix TaxID=77044 RepID=A0A1S8A7N2_ROSNE|nr:hypothetical protein SAMD00023353_2000550 [Rosellinia necatrix]
MDNITPRVRMRVDGRRGRQSHMSSSIPLRRIIFCLQITDNEVVANRTLVNKTWSPRIVVSADSDQSEGSRAPVH